MRPPDVIEQTPSAFPASCETAGFRVRNAPIVCGTDFSEEAARAVDVAAALAHRLNEELVLVHALDEESRTTLPPGVRDSLADFERNQLHDEGQRLAATHVKVVEAFRAGKPDAVLVDVATTEHARLLVVSSHGRKPPGRWLLGSIAEQIGEAAPIPTLVIRAAEPFVQWARGMRKLRIFVATDLSRTSEAALHWVNWLRELGRCDVVVTYLESLAVTTAPPEAYPSPFVAELLVETERVQARCFRRRVRALLGKKGIRIRVEKGWGRSDAHLIQMAREENADLLVVGAHQRHGFARLGHLSISRAILHYAPMSVACVPENATIPQLHHENHIHRDGRA